MSVAESATTTATTAADRQSAGSWLGDGVDALVEAALIAFAAFTVLYEVALLAGLDAWLTTTLWVPLAVAVVVVRMLVQVRSSPSGRRSTPSGSRSAGPASLRRLAGRDELVRLAGLVGGLLVLAACVLAATGVRAHFWPMWAAASAGTLLLLMRLLVSAPTRQPDPGRLTPASTSCHLVVAVTAAAAGMLSLFLTHSDGDDIYYVNRTTWVAQHGTFPVRDTLLSPTTYPSTFNGGLPVASFEGWLGGLAHLLHVQPLTMTYLVFPPVGTALLVWALWALSRAWAPRLPLLVWAGGLAFALMSAESTLGNFGLPRVWQGKVPAVMVVLPLIWVYATRWLQDDRCWSLVMLFVCGVAFTGLTSTGILLTPAVGAVIVLASLLLGRLRSGLVAATVLNIFPVVMGAVVIVASSAVGGSSPTARTPVSAFVKVFGEQGLMVALALVGLACAALLARPRVPAVMAGCAAVGSLVSLAPGVMDGVNVATGSGPVAWRLALSVPVAVCVGLLLVADRPAVLTEPARWAPPRIAALVRSPSATPVVLSVALGLVLLVAGTPVWLNPTTHRSEIASRPSWKVDAQDVQTVRGALMRPHGDGPVLMPQRYMGVLALSTTNDFAVNPRTAYTQPLKRYPGEWSDRALLTRFAGRLARPRAARLGPGLDRVQVSLACVPAGADKYVAALRRAGFRQPRRTGPLVCLVPVH